MTYSHAITLLRHAGLDYDIAAFLLATNPEGAWADVIAFWTP